jgi:hypothetical protein
MKKMKPANPKQLNRWAVSMIRLGMFVVAAALFCYGASGAENCNRLQSDVLRIVDVVPYVGKVCGKAYEVYGIYQ